MSANSSKFDTLFGSTEQRWQRIVNITYNTQTELFTLYFRTPADQVITQTVRSTAYLLVDSQSVLTGVTTAIKELAGPHPLRYIALFPTQSALERGKRRIAASYSERYLRNPELHYWSQPPVPALQFRTGITLFQGMSFHDVKAISLDIETFTANGKLFSDATDPDDRIIIITLCSNRGKQWLLQLEQNDERRLLQQLNDVIAAEDPDVIVGHNLLGFDLPYLEQRAAAAGVTLRFGRDGSRLWQSGAKRGGQPTWAAAGRDLVDTLPALIQYDFSARNLPNYQLKDAIVHLGLAEDRRDFDRSLISDLWSRDRETLLAYAQADARDTLRLYEILFASAFFQAQMLPFPFQQACSMGTGTKVDSLICRNYLLQGQALPPKGGLDGANDSGGLTEALELGWVRNVVKADAASLYPSICLRYGFHPRQDHLGQFLATLRELTDRRLQAKQQLKQLTKGTGEYVSLNAWQSSLKILINSYYGMLGTGRLHFSDPEAAAAITRKGQAILRQMVTDVVDTGGLPIEIDTDGIYFVLPENCTLSPDTYVEQVLNSRQDDGIQIEFDGYYDAMYSYAAKNYLLQSGDQLIRKGVVFRSRRLYGFQNDVIGKFGAYLAANELPQLAEYYHQTRQRILQGELTKDEISTFAPVRADFADYTERLRRGGSHNRAYDLILNRPDREKWVRHSRIYYYHRQGGQLALADEFASDYDVKVYLELLLKTAEKFQYAFPPEVFRQIESGSGDASTLQTWHFTPNQERLRQYERLRAPQVRKLSFLDAHLSN